MHRHPVLTAALAATVAVLAACGGGQSASQATWREAWSERWAALSLGAEIDHPQPDCKGSTADPDVPVYDAFAGLDPSAATWARIGPVNGLAAGGGQLRVSNLLRDTGWALNSYRSFDPTRPIRLSGTVDLQVDAGAWVGLALIVDEADYREIVVYEQNGSLRAGIWAPCHIRPLVPVATGPRRIRLEYTPPPALICWRYFIDDALLAEERCDSDGAPLRAPARAGLYIVNTITEVLSQQGSVRAEVGPLLVETQ